MKKYVNFIAFAMMAVVSLSFVSCGGDDDDNNNPNNLFSNSIVGTWKGVTDGRPVIIGEGQGVEVELGESTSTEYVQYKSDGTFVRIEVDEYKYNELAKSEDGLKDKKEYHRYSGTYSAVGSKYTEVFDSTTAYDIIGDPQFLFTASYEYKVILNKLEITHPSFTDGMGMVFPPIVYSYTRVSDDVMTQLQLLYAKQQAAAK